jgi:DNA modification methylase
MDLGRYSLVLTDPPYGIGEADPKKNASRGKRTRFNGSSNALAYTRKYPDVPNWDETPLSAQDVDKLRSLADYQIIFGGNYFPLPPSRCWLVWDKVNGDTDFADCELAWTNLDQAVRKFSFMWNGMLRENRHEVRYHPTQKPLSLMKWCMSQAIVTGRMPLESVVDPYMGSGTTLIASKQFGVKAVGVDREEAYCEIAAKRLSQEVFDFEASR